MLDEMPCFHRSIANGLLSNIFPSLSNSASVKDGSETRRSLTFNGQKNYRELFAAECAEIDNQEIWRAGKTVRSLRVSNGIPFLVMNTGYLCVLNLVWFVLINSPNLKRKTSSS